jgi:hypothetical protein
MCCGVGNLEVKHSNPRNLYMSTLDQADIDVMKATKTCVSAQRFQYDYLNDDITDDGQIDYTLSNKVPPALRKAIAEGKKILVLINPPYGESANTLNKSAKSDIATTNIAKTSNGQGYANRELFTQFVVRVQKEIPSATLAMFSTLKYVNAPNFESFRGNWNAQYLGGFVVHSKAFDGLSGNFPIGFLVWKTQPLPREFPTQIQVDALNRDAQAIGEKLFHNIPKDRFLNTWIQRPRANAVDALPLKNALSPTTSTKDVRGTKWADGAIGSMLCDSNDLQGAGQGTALLSSGFCSAGAFFVTADNFWKVAIVFAVRLLIKHSWINHNDQFLQPSAPLPDEFKNDCLIWMLFHGKNLTASANGLEWNGKKWSIVNHFIPYTEAEVDAPDRFESDFMVQYLADKTLSTEATAVLDAGRTLWKAFFAHTDVRTVRDQYKLNRPDVGWYQIRNALAERNKSGDTAPVNFKPFESAYQALTDKLRPQVFSLGFLR